MSKLWILFHDEFPTVQYVVLSPSVKEAVASPEIIAIMKFRSPGKKFTTGWHFQYYGEPVFIIKEGHDVISPGVLKFLEITKSYH